MTDKPVPPRSEPETKNKARAPTARPFSRSAAKQKGPDADAAADAGEEHTSTRRIRSFVLRQGRFTPAQQRAFEARWSSVGVDYFGPEALPAGRDLARLFGAEATLQRPVVLEIGFGNGEALLHALAHQPEVNLIGVEVHLPGVGRLLRSIPDEALGRIRVYRHDAVEVLQYEIPAASLSEVRIYFPDPWHKKRHQKRRLVQAEFLALVVSRLKPGGILHLATDWQDYAEQMLALVQSHPDLRNLAADGNYAPRPATRPETHFEQRGLRLGHGVWDLLYQRVR